MLTAQVLVYKAVLMLALSCMLSSCALLKPARPPAVDSDSEFYRIFSKKFGVRFIGTENKRLILAIDKWLGTPHRMGGCSKNGVDCSCFVQSVYQEAYGIALSRSSGDMYRDAAKIKKNELREADLVFLKGPDKKISHVGIYLKDNRFAHVTTAQGVVISSLDEDCYKNSFYAAGRIQGVWQE